MNDDMERDAAWDCQDTRQALGVYVLGAIDPAERLQVDMHTAGCRECRDELAGLAGLPALLARTSYDELEVESSIATLTQRTRRPLPPITRSCAQGITGLAVLLAGRKRVSLRYEWRSHLGGETGRGLPAGQRIRAALGFLVAAVHYRLQDAAGIGWKVAEAVLKSRRWSNVVVFGPAGIAAIIILRHDGAAGMLASYESIAAIGASLYGLVRVGRWWRDAKPSEPKARRTED